MRIAIRKHLRDFLAIIFQVFGVSLARLLSVWLSPPKL